MFRVTMYPSSGEILYLCDAGICLSVWVASGLLVGVKFQPADQTPPTQSDKYQRRTDTVFHLMMGTWLPEIYREEK